MATESVRLLNFGCGETFHPAWVNLDSSPVAPQVIAHDLHEPFPFPAHSFDAVYGSHVLEHLEPDAAIRLLTECHRVLKPGGIARIVAPDLEAIARLYLESLEGAAAGDADSEMRYDWALLELYDQAVRKTTGGRMASYFSKPMDEARCRLVVSRIGEESLRPAPRPMQSYSIVSRILARLKSTGYAIRKAAAEACAYVLLGRQGSAALREGLFRRGGEVHQWMYDRFSMLRSLKRCGFVEVRICAADESAIADFPRYGLETQNGRIRKPDSLYTEGRKPARG